MADTRHINLKADDAPHPLAGLRVLDVGSGVGGSYCALLMAGLGAEVVRIESPVRPGDPPMGRTLWTALNRGKKCVTLDITDARGYDDLMGLVDQSDILVHGFLPRSATELGLQYDRLCERNAALVVTSVTPFGNVGPYSDFLADELIINALGGFIYGVGEPDREPLGGQGVQSQILAGACANAATLAALFARRKYGRGQQVDISVQEVTATLLEAAVTIASYTGWTWRRSGKRRAVAYHPISNYLCRNGYINISILEDREWRSFCDLIGCKELAEDPRFATSRERLDRADEVDALLANWLSARDGDEIYRMAQAHRLACGPVSTVPDLLASPHLGARGFFSIVPLDGREMAVTAPPFIMSAKPKPFTEDDCEPTSMADAGVALRGEQPSTDRPLPLADIRVLDCTHSWAGPLATQFLAYFGAEVIHVESLRHPDRWRGPVTPSQDSRFTYRYPHHEPGHQPYNRNALFNELNTGKSAIALDLTDPRGQEAFAALVRQSDAVVTNFSARAIHKLGLDHDSLTAINPAIISLSLTGLGGTGPDKDFLAWGTTIEAMSGLANRQGYLGGPPLLSNMAYGDPVGGMFGGVALLTALWHKQRTGAGQHIDLSLLECSTTLLLDAIADYSYDGTDHGRQGNRHADYAPRGCYPCAGEDRWIAISVMSDDQWRRLCCEMGRPSWADDPRFATPEERHVHHDNLDQAIAAWTSQQDRDAVMKSLQAAGVPAGAVLDNTELLSDPQLNARGFFTELHHPQAGTHRYPGLPLRLSRTPGVIDRAAPIFGAHNYQILRNLAGLSDDEIRALEEARIIGDTLTS